MAGSILKRTCFYSIVDGTVRPHEWAVVIHSEFGPMVEPFWPFGCNMHRLGGSKDGIQLDDFSSTNQTNMVNEFVEVDDGKLIMSLNFGDQTKYMHGGRNYPRSGR